MFNQVYLTGMPAHAFDWECIRKDGTRRFVEVSVTLKRGIYGKPVGFMGISRDITAWVSACCLTFRCRKHSDLFREYSKRRQHWLPVDRGK